MDSIDVEIRNIPINKLETNKGQIDGLPKNPRFIRDARFTKLKESIKDASEMLHIRELIVMPHNGKYVVIGGNMRLNACKDLGFDSVPCKILPSDTSVEKLREYAIKDNNEFGENDWDILANEWDEVDLDRWGIEFRFLGGDGNEMNHEDKETAKLSGLEYDPLYYEPKNKPKLKLEDCLNLEKFNAKLSALKEYDLSEQQMEILKMFAYRFIKIDFEAVANYYAFNADENERKAIERLRLVLVDGGG